jgi:steroid delta-isomerase-like uncharacterized protein
MASRRELEEITERWIDQGWRKGDADAVLAMYADHFVDLSSPYAGRGTRDDNVRGIRDLYAAFPDFHTEIDDLVIDTEAGKVAVRWTATGTHQGEFLGVATTGNSVTFRGIETLRIVDGMIVERAGEWDGIEILRQIGGLG